nr:retrovirus-related Pol polyprotein from transposon TNT 1-94 [Tanacetum cinerariifolium]
SSLKPYVPNVILEKIIIDLEDEVENPKVIAPGMFKLNVSQCVSLISMSKSSCDSNNVEIKLKRKRHTFSSVRRPKNSGVIWKKKGSSNNSNVGLSACVRTDNGTEFKNKTLSKFFDEIGITQQFSAARTPKQNGVVERRNRTLVEAARTMLTFANLPSFHWAEAIATACFIQNCSIIHKRFDKTPYELINKRKPNIKFFHVFGCRCYLLNDYKDVGNLKTKGDIGVLVGYSKESAAFRIYNKRTRKIHKSVNVNFDELSEMASKQFSLEPGLSNLNETGKSSDRLVSKVDEASKNDLEDLFQDFYDEYFDSSKIMKSSTMNVETSINESRKVLNHFKGNLLYLH